MVEENLAAQTTASAVSGGSQVGLAPRKEAAAWSWLTWMTTSTVVINNSRAPALPAPRRRQTPGGPALGGLAQLVRDRLALAPTPLPTGAQSGWAATTCPATRRASTSAFPATSARGRCAWSGRSPLGQTPAYALARIAQRVARAAAESGMSLNRWIRPALERSVSGVAAVAYQHGPSLP